MNFQQKIKEFTQKYNMLCPETKVLVALSGGADSVALLEVLCALRKEMPLKLMAVHVHHGIRERAEHDAVFCKVLCKQKEVAFACERIDVPALAKEKGLSLEEAGRIARYEIFERYRKEYDLDVIAVAHHKNDQAETMLFQLFRGSGLRGLAVIPLQRDAIIRPLMAVTKEEIEAFLQEQKLLYVLDETNGCDEYSRNKIRHHILPQAEEICPAAVENMSRAAILLREMEAYMELQSEAFLKKHSLCENERISIPIEPLVNEHIALQKTIVMLAICQMLKSRKDITEKHIDAVLSLLDKEGEKNISLPQGYVATKQYGTLILGKEEAKDESGFSKPQEIIIQPGEEKVLPNGQWIETKIITVDNLENIPKSDCMKWFDYDKITHTLVARTRNVGDYLTIDEKGSKQSLQDYLVNEKVPKSDRDACILIADDSHILWVLGKRISAHYKVTEHTKRILQVSIGEAKDERKN